MQVIDLGAWTPYLEQELRAPYFAALLQREFEIFRRYREEDPASRNSRIDQLLRALELDRDEGEIPWERVSAHLKDMRRQGLDFLRALVEERP